MFKRKKEQENFDAYEDIEIFDDPSDMKRRSAGGKVRLSVDKRRSYLTILISLAAVLAASSCVLVLLLINSSNKRQELTDAKDTEMAEKLGQIEDYLTAIDTRVMDESISVTTADNYRQLSTTVDSLKNNLTQYRDDNDITNGEIGSNLDDVISQLGKIQTELDKRRDEEKSEGNELDNRLDSISKSSKEAEDSLSSDLSRVHESISSLIEKTGEDQTGNYLELKGILSATDSNFTDLVSDRFNAQGQLIEEKTGQLDREINSVRNDVKGSLGAVDTTLTAMNQTVSENMNYINESNVRMNESLGTINENLAGVSDAVLEKIDSNSEYVSDIESRVSELKDAMETGRTDNEERLTAIKEAADVNSKKSDKLEKKVDMLQELIEKICEKMNINTGEDAGGAEGPGGTGSTEMDESGTHSTEGSGTAEPEEGIDG